MIRAVLFDFGNVVCSFSIEPFLRRIARHSRRPLEELQRLIPSFTAIGREYETGLVSSDEFFVDVCRRAGLSIERDQFIKDYCDIFTPISPTFDLVRRLKRNYVLGLVSNTNEWHFEYGIRPVEIYPLFDAVTLSFQVKAMKPDRRVYDDILSKVKVQPPECVYIDDMQENVDAAGALGLRAIRYVGPEPLLAALHSLGLSW